MVRHLFTLFLLLLAVCHAQRILTTDDVGETIIETVSIDQWTETWTEVISTILPTTKRKGAAAAAAPATATATTATSASPAGITAVTAAVATGSIAAYAPYESSVSVGLASAASSAWAEYTATATLVGLNVSSGTSLQVGARGIFAALVAVFALLHYA